MEAHLMDYEQKKRAIRLNQVNPRRSKAALAEIDDDLQDTPAKSVRLSDVAQVGSKVLIGGGIGLLAGVATIAVVASAAEIVIAGVITKIAGVIGGALGLSMGIRKFKK
jgi:hypothetical protein